MQATTTTTRRTFAVDTNGNSMRGEASSTYSTTGTPAGDAAPRPRRNSQPATLARRAHNASSAQPAPTATANHGRARPERAATGEGAIAADGDELTGAPVLPQ